jgi:putative phosphoribosyl transferase
MPDPGFRARSVQIAAGAVDLAGDLIVPEGAAAIVLFAHGSGSSRHSPRNQLVARRLAETGLATLLFDLLTPAEQRYDRATGGLRFDVLLLADRLLQAAEWVRRAPGGRILRIGFFGSSTGAAAALITAAARPDLPGAIVSRGGRPDLAGEALDGVCAPTLLIVGGEDHLVMDLNELACSRLHCEKRLEVVPGATHLFEEAGKLERVADLAAAWFGRFLVEETTRPADPDPAPPRPCG